MNEKEINGSKPPGLLFCLLATAVVCLFRFIIHEFDTMLSFQFYPLSHSGDPLLFYAKFFSPAAATLDPAFRLSPADQMALSVTQMLAPLLPDNNPFYLASAMLFLVLPFFTLFSLSLFLKEILTHRGSIFLFLFFYALGPHSLYSLLQFHVPGPGVLFFACALLLAARRMPLLFALFFWVGGVLMLPGFYLPAFSLSLSPADIGPATQSPPEQFVGLFLPVLHSHQHPGWHANLPAWGFYVGAVLIPAFLSGLLHFPRLSALPAFLFLVCALFFPYAYGISGWILFFAWLIAGIAVFRLDKVKMSRDPLTLRDNFPLAFLGLVLLGFLALFFRSGDFPKDSPMMEAAIRLLLFSGMGALLIYRHRLQPEKFKPRLLRMFFLILLVSDLSNHFWLARRYAVNSARNGRESTGLVPLDSPAERDDYLNPTRLQTSP